MMNNEYDDHDRYTAYEMEEGGCMICGLNHSLNKPCPSEQCIDYWEDMFRMGGME